MKTLKEWDELEKEAPLVFEFFKKIFSDNSLYAGLTLDECAGGVVYIVESLEELNKIRAFGDDKTLEPETINSQSDGVDFYKDNIIIFLVTNNNGGDSYVIPPDAAPDLKEKALSLFNAFVN